MIAKDDQINDQNDSKKNKCFSQFKNGTASFLRFIKHIKLSELFSQLPDKRQQSKIDYSIASLVLWAFSLCFFRQESKNKFHTTLQYLEPHERRGILYCGALSFFVFVLNSSMQPPFRSLWKT